MPGLGDESLLSVDAVLHAIARSPEQYQMVHGTTRRALLRRFPYAIFFEVNEQQVVVLAILHLKRNPRRWKDRASSAEPRDDPA